MDKRKFTKSAILMMGSTAIMSMPGLVMAKEVNCLDGLKLKPIQLKKEVMRYVNKIPGKITVVEFFWYGCSHCNDLQPYVRDWLKEKDGGVQIIRIPAVFNPQWGVGASFFYSLHESGLFSEELHEKTFDAVHKSKSLNLSDAQSVKSFLAGNGVSFGDVQKISDLMKSQKVAKRVEAAAKASNEYMIPGTPAMVIENKYLMTATEAEGTKNLVNEVKNVVKALRLCKN